MALELRNVHLMPNWNQLFWLVRSLKTSKPIKRIWIFMMQKPGSIRASRSLLQLSDWVHQMFLCADLIPWRLPGPYVWQADNPKPPLNLQCFLAPVLFSLLLMHTHRWQLQVNPRKLAFLTPLTHQPQIMYVSISFHRLMFTDHPL